MCIRDSCYGIDPVLLYWICSFLSNRFQYVKVDQSYSPVLPVISGVPQGSVPLVLYCLYYMLTIFALWLRLESPLIPVNCLQSCLTAIFDWFQHWQLKLSPERNNEIFSKLHNPSKYPTPYSRTKKYQSFLNYALAKFQNSM